MDFFRYLVLAGTAAGFLSCSQTLPQDPLQSYRPLSPPEVQTLQSEPPGFTRQAPPDSSAEDPLNTKGLPQPGLTDLGRESVLQLRNSTGVFPKDYRIGSLADSLGPEQRAAREVLVRFLDSLAQDKSDLAMVHSQWRTLITSTLEIQKSNWPRSFRIGPVFLETEDTVRVTVALTGVNGRADGWIYLEKEGAAWRISDWQVDLLTIPEKKPDEVFDPEGFPLIRGFP